MKQTAKPKLSPSGQQQLSQYETYLTTMLDLQANTRRNYVGDVHLFIGWYEQGGMNSAESVSFALDAIGTPTITRYRDYLQNELRRKPNTINRYLISIKRFFAWATDEELILRDPTRPVKLVDQVVKPPRHLSDQEEAALVSAVTHHGNIRDLALITVMLHTGLRVNEICNLQWEHVISHKRSGHLKVWGKRNKYREVPLNATARQILHQLKQETGSKTETKAFLFVSQRTRTKLTTRGLGFLVAKYADRAQITSLRPHDLRHRFGYRMAEQVPLHRLAQIMGHDSLDTTMLYVRGTSQDLQQAVETIAWQ